MILYDAIKHFVSNDLNQPLNRIFPFENIKAQLSIIEVCDYVPPIMNVLLDFGFNEVIQLELGEWAIRNNNIFFMKEQSINYIVYWRISENNGDPLVFDIVDIISEDITFNIFRYGKILLKEIG